MPGWKSWYGDTLNHSSSTLTSTPKHEWIDIYSFYISLSPVVLITFIFIAKKTVRHTFASWIISIKLEGTAKKNREGSCVCCDEYFWRLTRRVVSWPRAAPPCPVVTVRLSVSPLGRAYLSHGPYLHIGIDSSSSSIIYTGKIPLSFRNSNLGIIVATSKRPHISFLSFYCFFLI